MFGIFKSKNKGLPITDEQRKWLEHAFMYLLHEFDHDKIVTRAVMTPTRESFNYIFNKDKSEVHRLGRQIAQIMEINPEEVQLDFFSGGIKEFRTNTGDLLFLGQEEEQNNPVGQYFNKSSNGKYLIALSDALLEDPENLIATIAHEYSHIKLLGEGRSENNDEFLTDVVPLMFGLGIFAANSSFKFQTNAQGWSQSRSGYLSQMDWGYLLALYAFMRYEDNPAWRQFLNKQLQADFDICLEFILANKDFIFQHLKKE